MQNNTNRRSAIDERPPRHAGYRVTISKRSDVEKPFGWMKQIGGVRKVKLRGLAKVEWLFAFTCAAYNLLRIPELRGGVRNGHERPSAPAPSAPGAESQTANFHQNSNEQQVAGCSTKLFQEAPSRT